jgi:type II secretory pathway pseudopilin PulG
MVPPCALPNTVARRFSQGGGFSYIGLLIFIALIGIALAGTGMVTRTESQREKERELLFVGSQFRHAIELYYERSPGGAKQFPQALEDLLIDKRYPATQRYLRRIYPDPMSGKLEWGLVKGPEDRIIGVYSMSEQAPRKRFDFPLVYRDFENKDHYKEWRFVYIPQAQPTQGQQPQTAKSPLLQPSEALPSAPPNNK